MKKFCLVSLAAAGLFMSGCTVADRFFGNEMLPPSQQMNTLIDTVKLFSTYQITFDSVSGRLVGPTAFYSNPMAYLGSVIDPLVGRTTVGVVGNFVPEPYTKNEDWQKALFGVNPTIDSMKLIVLWDDSKTVGDTTARFKVSVYEINERLRSYKSYLTTFKTNGIYDPSRPVAEFTTSGKGFNWIKLPSWYFEQFLTLQCNLPGAHNPYGNDSLFLDTFKGLYFKVDPVEPGKRGLIGAMDLSLTRMQLHYHNKNEKPDTSNVFYCFYYVDPETGVYYTPSNTSITVATHDYELATDPRGVNLELINNLSVPCETGFVQGLGGLALLARMDMEQVKALQKKAVELGYTHMGVHRAELRWKVPAQSLFYYNDSFVDLVAGNWVNSRSGVGPLPDYNPWDVVGANSIGGVLVRSLGYYAMDITSYMQQVINGKNTNGDLVILPDFGASSDIFDPWRSALSGSQGPDHLKPEIIVTYTLIR